MSVTVEDFTSEWNRELDRRNRFSHILRGIARENAQSLNAAELNKMEIDEKIRQAIYVWAHRNQRGRYLHSHKGKARRQHKRTPMMQSQARYRIARMVGRESQRTSSLDQLLIAA